MRMLKILFPMVLFFGVAATVHAADKNAKPGNEQPVDQTGSLTGTIHAPEKEAPKGAVAALHQGKVGEESIYFLFAEGSVERKLKDLAKNGGTATVSGTITKEGYRVSSISNIVKAK